METPARHYLRDFIPAMVGYTLALPISITLLLRVPMPLLLRVAAALLPMLPMVFVVRAIVRHVQRIDELQQRIQIQAIAIASVLVGMLTFGVGFLQNARLLPSPPWLMLWVLPCMIWTWGLASALIARRFRHD
jgi:hypothetical protein